MLRAHRRRHRSGRIFPRAQKRVFRAPIGSRRSASCRLRFSRSETATGLAHKRGGDLLVFLRLGKTGNEDHHLGTEASFMAESASQKTTPSAISPPGQPQGRARSGHAEYFPVRSGGDAGNEQRRCDPIDGRSPPPATSSNAPKASAPLPRQHPVDVANAERKNLPCARRAASQLPEAIATLRQHGVVSMIGHGRSVAPSGFQRSRKSSKGVWGHMATSSTGSVFRPNGSADRC